MHFSGIRDIQDLIKIAHIQQELSWVKNYLNMSDREKAIDLIVTTPWPIKDLIENNQELFSEDFYNKFVDDPSEFVFSGEWDEDAYKTDKENLISLVEKNLGSVDDYDLPAWNYFDDAKVIQNTWLIHFTDEARSIAYNGFNNLVSDMRLLGLTTRVAPNSIDRSEEGYGFAYLAHEFSRYAKNRRGLKYGDECVVFTASGIRAWHSGDEEPQTIFYGPTARNIVPITSGLDARYGVWDIRNKQTRHKTDNVIYENEELEPVVDWIVSNYDQYKNVIAVR